MEKIYGEFRARHQGKTQALLEAIWRTPPPVFVACPSEASARRMGVRLAGRYEVKRGPSDSSCWFCIYLGVAKPKDLTS